MKGKILECQMECLLMAKVPVSITPHLFLMVLTMKLLKSIQVITVHKTFVMKYLSIVLLIANIEFVYHVLNEK